MSGEARAEVVVAGLRVALFALKLIGVRGRTSVGLGQLPSEGSEVGVIADHSGGVGDHARAAQEVFHVVLRIAAGGEDGDGLAAEEDIFGGGVAGGIRLGQNVAPRAVPVEFGIGLVDAAAVAVVGVVSASSPHTTSDHANAQAKLGRGWSVFPVRRRIPVNDGLAGRKAADYLRQADRWSCKAARASERSAMPGVSCVIWWD